MPRLRFIDLFLAAGSVAMGGAIAILARFGAYTLGLGLLGLATACVTGWLVGRKLGLTALERKIERNFGMPEFRTERWDKWWEVRHPQTKLPDEAGGEKDA